MENDIKKHTLIMTLDGQEYADKYQKHLIECFITLYHALSITKGRKETWLIGIMIKRLI